MKILTKILNLLAVILVVIGIISVIGYFFKYKPLKMNYEKLLKENRELSYQQEVNQDRISKLDYKVFEKNEIIKERESTITSLRDDLDKATKNYEDKIEKLQNITLEEAVSIILDYYNVSDDNAEIIMHDNVVQIAFKPRLVKMIPMTLAKVESQSERLSVYENQVLEYDSLVVDYKDKIQMLEERDSLNANNYELEKDKNINLQTIIDNRNQKIKSLKIQRNSLGIITGVVIVLAIL